MLLGEGWWEAFQGSLIRNETAVSSEPAHRVPPTLSRRVGIDSLASAPAANPGEQMRAPTVPPEGLDRTVKKKLCSKARPGPKLSHACNYTCRAFASLTLLRAEASTYPPEHSQRRRLP
ncbi:hypothetical protein AAFF_G00203920 [Aldrovandia affinis]|uniref:Uncharacterized protein n=1 Tax=Aldrovandia affinis TaxID=143900 RepID=A0AAD7WUW0_9TELE|nr:hypothetical protein AAFF_G00203920 [Aldrovandia affinis]